MTKATNVGKLNPVDKCNIRIPIDRTPIHLQRNRDKIYDIVMNNLPDISDSKSAVYNQETVIGRSFPLYTYSHSGDRQISIQIHFFAINKVDIKKNLLDLRAIQSAVYPRQGISGEPYRPPPVCQIVCGNLLSGNPASKTNTLEPLCVILQSYSVKFPTEVAWDEESYLPYRFDVDTTWLVVYTSEDLPFQNRIFKSGR
jgi:hypothetical protein